MTGGAADGADRPRLHLTPRTGWLNDPLALTWREDADGGRYHLFFQHVPESVEWAAHCHWGRATSTDLVHWEEQPVALAPAVDELGAWSGCLVEGRILYTSVQSGEVERGSVRVALPADDTWTSWTPGDVVLGPPQDPAVTYFRDPFVVAEAGRWRMLVGAGRADGTGCALGYVSSDLVRWEPDRTVAERHTDETDPVWTGAVWECPQLVRLPDADLLVVSTADGAVAGDVVVAVGTFEAGRLAVRSWQQLTTGAPYAASVFRDRHDRPGLVTWLRGISGDGWAGAVSAPFVISSEGDQVSLSPHEDLERCRAPWDPDAHAWDLEWDGTGELHLVAAGHPPVVLSQGPGVLELTTAERRLTLARPSGTGTVRVLRDGAVLEVMVGGRVAAAAVPGGPLRPEGRGWQGWALR